MHLFCCSSLCLRRIHSPDIKAWTGVHPCTCTPRAVAHGSRLTWHAAHSPHSNARCVSADTFTLVACTRSGAFFLIHFVHLCASYLTFRCAFKISSPEKIRRGFFRLRGCRCVCALIGVGARWCPGMHYTRVLLCRYWQTSIGRGSAGSQPPLHGLPPTCFFLTRMFT